MITSDQINQQVSSYPGAWRAGYGMNSPQWRGDSGFAGTTPWGPGAGDAMGVGMLSGASSAVNFAGTVGTVGAAAKWAGVGPKWLHATRYAAGFGFGSGIGGLAAGMGVGMAIPAMFGAMASGAMDQSAMNENVMNTVGNRVGLGGRGNQGFSRSGMQQIGNLAREMAELPQLLTNMGELTEITRKLSEAGMLNSAKNLSDFKSKFSENIKSLRDMSKIVGSTMEEAVSIASELHQMGIVDPRTRTIMAAARQATSMVGVGMNVGLVGQVQGMGANLATRFGGNRATGMMGATNLLQTLSVAQQRGTISEQEVTNLTGQAGEAGLASLGVMTQEKITSMMTGTGMGGLMSAAMGEIKDGRFTGGIDKTIAEAVRSGSISKEELVSLGQSKLSSQKAITSFSRNKRELSFNAAQSIGIEGVINQIRQMVDGLDNEDEDITAKVAETFLGGDQKLAEILMKTARDSHGISRQVRSDTKSAIESKLSQDRFKRYHTMGGKWERAKHWMGNTFVAPFERAGADFSYQMGEMTDNLTNYLNDTNVVSTYGEGEMTAARSGIITGNYLSSAGISQRDKNLINNNAIDNLADYDKEWVKQKAQRFRDGKDSLAELSMKVKKGETQEDKLNIFYDEVAGPFRSQFNEEVGRTDLTKSTVSALMKELGINEDSGAYVKISPSAKMSKSDERGMIEDIFGDSWWHKNITKDTQVEQMLKAGGATSSVLLDLTLGEKTTLGGKEYTLSQLQEMSDDKLKKIGEAAGISKEDLDAVLEKVGDKTYQWKAGRRRKDLEKLRDSKLAGAQDLLLTDIRDTLTEGMESMKGYSGSLKEDLVGVMGGLEDILNNKDSSAAYVNIDKIASKLGADPATAKKVRAELQKSGIPDGIISAIENRAAFNKKKQKAGTAGTEDELFAAFGISGEEKDSLLAEFKKGMWDQDSILTPEERSKAMEHIGKSGILGSLSSSRSTDFMNGQDKEAIQAETLMIKANTDFVNAVAVAIGNDDLTASAEKFRARAEKRTGRWNPHE